MKEAEKYEILAAFRNSRGYWEHWMLVINIEKDWAEAIISRGIYASSLLDDKAQYSLPTRTRSY